MFLPDFIHGAGNLYRTDSQVEALRCPNRGTAESRALSMKLQEASRTSAIARNEAVAAVDNLS